MKKIIMVAAVFGLGLAMLAVGLTNMGCGCGCRYPFTQTVDIDLGQGGYQMPSFGGLLAGVALPPGYAPFEIPLCADLPSQEDLNDLVAGAIGSVAANMIQIDSVELVHTTITADGEGDFNFLTLLGVSWLPKEGVVPDDLVDLGEEQDEAGLGAEIVLTPGQTVDLLALLNEAAEGPEGECVDLVIDVEGVVPETAPQFSITVTAEISGSVGL